MISKQELKKQVRRASRNPSQNVRSIKDLLRPDFPTTFISCGNFLRRRGLPTSAANAVEVVVGVDDDDAVEAVAAKPNTPDYGMRFRTRIVFW